MEKVEEIKTRPQLITSELTKEGTKSGFSVRNVGQYPASNLQVIIVSSAKNLDESNLWKHIQLSPPLEPNIKVEGDIIRLTLQRPLVPNAVLHVAIEEIPLVVSIQNQYGDLVQVYTTPSGGGGSSW